MEVASSSTPMADPWPTAPRKPKSEIKGARTGKLVMEPVDTKGSRK